MKIKSLLITLLCFYTISQAHELETNKITVQVSVEAEKKDVVSTKERIKRFYSTYAASLVASACVGAVTGSVVRYIEKKLNKPDSPIGFFLFILSFFYEPEIRHEILAALQMDFDTHGISYTTNSMAKMAWIASWVAFLR